MVTTDEYNQIIRLSMKANQYWKMTYQPKVDFTYFLAKHMYIVELGIRNEQWKSKNL